MIFHCVIESECLLFAV